MAAEKTGLNFNWRTAKERNSDSYNPPALENDFIPGQEQIKCYRNVIYLWLFHTPVILNWIDDHHRRRCDYDGDIVKCAICRFRDLARRFWSADRERDTTFNDDVDQFWGDAMTGQWDWDVQNDAQEYMEKLVEYFDRSRSDPEWTKQLISPHIYHLQVCTKCLRHTQTDERRHVLKGRMPRKDIDHQTLETSLQLHRQLESTGDQDELCESCNQTRTPHAKAHPLVFPPPILPIHIEPGITDTYEKFFKGSLSKLEPSMAFSSYANANSSTEMNSSTLQWTFYHLYGVIMRKGITPIAGHYVGAFEQERGHWLLFDDVDKPGGSKVMSLEQVENMQRDGWRVFMLAYRREFSVPVQDFASVQPTVQSPVQRLMQVQRQVEAGTSTGKRLRNESQSEESERLSKRRAQSRPTDSEMSSVRFICRRV